MTDGVEDAVLVAYYSESIAAGSNHQGHSTLKYAQPLGRLIARTGARTLLDYGCGRARHYAPHHRLHETWGVPLPALYEPHWPPYARKPAGTFDGVICVDVLEHVPEDAVDATLAEVISYARRFAFLAICCRASSKTLPDGRNEHLTIRPPEWWQARIDAVTRGPAEVVVVWAP